MKSMRKVSIIFLIAIFAVQTAANAQFCANNQAYWKSPEYLRKSILQYWMKQISKEFKQKVNSKNYIRITCAAEVSEKGALSNVRLLKKSSSSKANRLALEIIKRHSPMPEEIADQHVESGVKITLCNKIVKPHRRWYFNHNRSKKIHKPILGHPLKKSGR